MWKRLTYEEAFQMLKQDSLAGTTEEFIQDHSGTTYYYGYNGAWPILSLSVYKENFHISSVCSVKDNIGHWWESTSLVPLELIPDLIELLQSAYDTSKE